MVQTSCHHRVIPTNAGDRSLSPEGAFCHCCHTAHCSLGCCACPTTPRGAWGPGGCNRRVTLSSWLLPACSREQRCQEQGSSAQLCARRAVRLWLSRGRDRGERRGDGQEMRWQNSSRTNQRQKASSVTAQEPARAALFCPSRGCSSRTAFSSAQPQRTSHEPKHRDLQPQ